MQGIFFFPLVSKTRIEIREIDSRNRLCKPSTLRGMHLHTTKIVLAEYPFFVLLSLLNGSKILLVAKVCVITEERFTFKSGWNT